jgi:Family of unknown function (DUF6029)
MVNAQNFNLGEIHGNIQLDGQYYTTDSTIRAFAPPEKMGLNGYANILYNKGNFNAGIRYELYAPPLLGFPAGAKWSGSGIGYKFVQYNLDGLDVTFGNYYEQFGNGLIFRTWEDRNLGVDNAMEGLRVKYKLNKGLYIKGIYGKQRLAFDNGLINGNGLVRGADLEIDLNEILDSISTSKTRIVLGGSFISKYQKDEDPLFNYPENVNAFAGRIAISRGKFALNGEYAYKTCDPSLQNSAILKIPGYLFPGVGLYKKGHGIFANASFSQKGLGVSFTAKSIDNMSFQSNRSAGPFDLNINYLPASTLQQTYNLAATLYPYATQPNGEVSYMAEIFYNVKKNSTLGGKYGMDIAVNSSVIYAPKFTVLNDLETSRMGVKTTLFSAGKELYYSDINIKLSKKISSKLKASYMFLNYVYNGKVLKGAYDYENIPFSGMIYADIHVAELQYKIKSNQSVRVELQFLKTKQHLQDWTTGLVEYSVSPHWFFSIMDQWNYGNDNPDKRFHFLIGSAGYIKNANRFTISYGKQRAGIFCVGGVCRIVPASNGVTLSMTSSF